MWGSMVGDDTECLKLVQGACTHEFGGVRAKERRKLATKMMDEHNGERNCG